MAGMELTVGQDGSDADIMMFMQDTGASTWVPNFSVYATTAQREYRFQKSQSGRRDVLRVSVLAVPQRLLCRLPPQTCP